MQSDTFRQLDTVHVGVEEIEHPAMRDFDAEAEQIIKALRGTTVAALGCSKEKKAMSKELRSIAELRQDAKGVRDPPIGDRRRAVAWLLTTMHPAPN